MKQLSTDYEVPSHNSGCCCGGGCTGGGPPTYPGGGGAIIGPETELSKFMKTFVI